MADARKRPELTDGEKELAALYQRVLGGPEGEKLLLDLAARFYDRPIYVPGGEEGARETERRAAQHEVIAFILRQLGQVT